MVVHAGCQRFLPVSGHGMGRHGDDGQLLEIWIASYYLGGLIAIHDRHLNVHEHRVKRVFSHRLHSLLAVRGQGNLNICTCKNLQSYLLIDFIILHQQHPDPPERFLRLGFLNESFSRGGWFEDPFIKDLHDRVKKH